jgi:sugar lactone lactonase YvrE
MSKRWMILGIAFILIPLIFLVGKGDGEEKERVIYVGDVVKIQKFDEDGNFLGIIERPRLTKKGNDLDNLRRNIVSDLEVDEEGNLYVITFKGFTLEGVKNEILKFDKNGNFVVRFGEEFLPCGITIDKEGNLFITTDDCQVKKITKDGKFILSFGKKGKDKGEFMLPHGIAIDNDGNVYVTDTHNHRIQKFTSNGKFILSFGKKGKDKGEFDSPYGIAIDNDGNVYVTDTHNHRIQKFTSNGKFILSFGKKGKDKGEFDSPYGIAIDNDGNVYVTDTHNHRIQKFTKDGEFILAFGESLGDIHPQKALEWYAKEILKKDLEDVSLEDFDKVSPEELDRDLKRIFSIYLMREGKFCAPAAIAVNF